MSVVGNSNLSAWKMGDIEIGYTIIPPYCSSGGSQLLYIPKLMPKIGRGKPKVTPASLSASCYCNDKACKPSVAKKISTQNYITVRPQDNRSFKLPVFWNGTKVYIEVRNGNPDQMRLSTKEDNSSTP